MLMQYRVILDHTISIVFGTYIADSMLIDIMLYIENTLKIMWNMFHVFSFMLAAIGLKIIIFGFLCKTYNSKIIL